MNTALLSSTSSCFTFITGLTEPQVIESTVSPNRVTLTTSSSADTQTFSCSFNVDVIQPTTSSYIKVYSASTNLQVYSLDASLSTTFTSSTNMSFIIPIGNLTPGSYYILFDWGNFKLTNAYTVYRENI